jgi:hypothetical protein
MVTAHRKYIKYLNQCRKLANSQYVCELKFGENHLFQTIHLSKVTETSFCSLTLPLIPHYIATHFSCGFLKLLFNRRTSLLQKYLHRNYFTVQRSQLIGRRARSVSWGRNANLSLKITLKVYRKKIFLFLSKSDLRVGSNYYLAKDLQKSCIHIICTKVFSLPIKSCVKWLIFKA